MPKPNDTIGASAPTTKLRSSRSKRARFEIFERDSFTCQYCGRRPPDVILQLDHIHPVSKGGADTEDNLTTSCADCNAGKTNRIMGGIIPRPDANIQMLTAQQEIAEARAYLEAKSERDDLYQEIGEHLLKLWTENIQTYYTEPSPSTLHHWIKIYGADQVEHAILTASWRDKKQCFTGGRDGCLKYAGGILRKRQQESNG